MPKYLIDTYERVCRAYLVEAETPEEALRRVEDYEVDPISDDAEFIGWDGATVYLADADGLIQGEPLLDTQ